MFVKLKTNDLIQIGYSLTEIADSVSKSTDEKGNHVVNYEFNSGYSYHECIDEDVFHRTHTELNNYINPNYGSHPIYNIKYYKNKRNAEEILDSDGKSHDPKQYVQSHFVGDDSAKDARLLADKWANVRSERNSKLAETDYLALSDNTLATNMKTYRQKLRDVPKQSDPDNITWPTKP